MRSATPDDRRYLLYNPIVKMKVTTEGEQVIDLLWDVIAAKGFEKDMYFEMAARDIRGAAEARGHGAREHRADRQVHGRASSSTRPSSTRCRRRDDAGRRRVPLPPGPGARARARSASTTGGASTTRFADVPNVARLRRAGRGRSSELLATAPPDRGAAAGPRLPARRSASCSRWSSTAQLILEKAAIDRARRRHRSTRSSTCFVRDFSAYAIDLHGKASATEAQQDWALRARPQAGRRRRALRARLGDRCAALAGAYEMRP